MKANEPRQEGRLLPVGEMAEGVCRNLKVLFTDIDDTLTSEGLLPAGSYASVWDLHGAGVSVVPVTGRPAGWCDHIARMWPVAGVVGENGAFYFRYDRPRRRMIRSYTLSREEREEGGRRLQLILQRVLREVPGAGVAADQPFRIADLAVDYCEDVEPLDRAAVRRICSIAEEEGANCRVSSIHVNCWYGEFSKMSCVRLFVEEQMRVSFESMQDRILFIGDSPNDEPMFRGFETSIGVANLRSFAEELTYLPRYVTREKGARGFQEAVKVILMRRRNLPEQDINPAPFPTATDPGPWSER